MWVLNANSMLHARGDFLESLAAAVIALLKVLSLGASAEADLLKRAAA
jgi:hypothetical protein